MRKTEFYWQMVDSILCDIIDELEEVLKENNNEIEIDDYINNSIYANKLFCVDDVIFLKYNQNICVSIIDLSIETILYLHEFLSIKLKIHSTQMSTLNDK